MGQRKKNQRKTKNKRRCQERRASESENSEGEAEKERERKTEEEEDDDEEENQEHELEEDVIPAVQENEESSPAESQVNSRDHQPTTKPSPKGKRRNRKGAYASRVPGVTQVEFGNDLIFDLDM